MELKVGMYVRTDKGMLGKLVTKEKDSGGFILNYYGKYNKKVWSSNGNDDEIIKSSHNIIDLIEDDDIVEIEYYVKKYKKRISRKFVCNRIIDNFISFENTHCAWTITFENNKWNWNNAKGFNPQIKSIVTHEQFDSVKYEVERKI